jgi:hypothetical protein
VASAWVGTSASAQNSDVDRVLLLRNGNSPISLAVANDYARRRGVRNVLTVMCPDAARDAEFETIVLASFQSCIEKPLRSFLREHSGIDFIVLTKGIPIRLRGAGQGDGAEWFSLDSHLAALDYEKMSGAVPVEIDDPESRAYFIANYHRAFHAQAWANRYWNSAVPFTHAKFGGYLVTRLDGYTEADAKALTTRALQAGKRRVTATYRRAKYFSIQHRGVDTQTRLDSLFPSCHRHWLMGRQPRLLVRRPIWVTLTQIFSWPPISSERAACRSNWRSNVLSAIAPGSWAIYPGAVMILNTPPPPTIP